MEYKNILIIKMSSLGDVLHTLPFAQSLRDRFPNAKISWLVHPQFADFIPYPNIIDEIIFFDKVAFKKMSLSQKLKYILKTKKELREKHFDLAIDMQGLFKSAVFAFLSGCKNRIGYCEMRELSSLVSKTVCGKNRNEHVIERYLDVARFLGANINEIKFPMPDLSEEEKNISKKLKTLSVHGDFIVIAPSARWKTKEWLSTYYAKLAKMIAEENFYVVLAGSPADKEKGAEICSLAKSEKIVNLIGKTTLKELGALIKQSFMFISADTGPLHIATAFKKPIIALYGPTLAERTGPYANKNASVILSPALCRGCLKKKCKNWRCMSDISPEIVYNKFKEKIGKLND